MNNFDAELKEIAECIEGEINKEKRKFIKLGMELEKLQKEFWFADLLKFLKGEDEEHHGSLYFCNLKPLYDKYGYELINTILMEEFK